MGQRRSVLTVGVVGLGLWFVGSELMRPLATSALPQAHTPRSSSSITDSDQRIKPIVSAVTESASPKAGHRKRRRARKPFRPQNPDASVFASALRRLQTRITGCVEADAPRADAPHNVKAGEQPLLLIDVQFRGGNLEIVDASFQRRGGISSAAADCVVNTLRGEAIPSAIAYEEEGMRMTVPFPLQ